MQRIPAVLFSMLILAFVATSVAAQTASQAPQVKVEHYELSNGLDVILSQDTSIPAVAVNIWYHVGSKNEKKGRTGFAHLFEHMMFQGSEHYNDDVFKMVDQMGGECNGSTNSDRTNYYEVIPSNYLEQVLALDADRMGFLLPAMDQAKLDNQRDVVKNERRQRVENEPYAVVWDVVPPLLYPPEHGYSWNVIGSMEDLSAASLTDVQDFFRKYYVPNNASLCITGKFDPEQTKQWVEKYFGSIPPGTPIQRVESFVPKLTQVRRDIAEDHVTLPRIYMEWTTPGWYKPGDAEFDLLATILGNGQTSRLYKSLVYEKQIAQDVSVAQSSQELNGEFEITATARPGHTLDELEKAIDAELNLMLTKGVTLAEVTAAQNIWETNFTRSLENIRDKADLLNNYNTFIGDPNKLEFDLARHRNATPTSINQFAKQYIDLNGRLIVYVVPQGDLAAAKEQVDRTQKPAVAADPKFDPPVPQKDVLPNGLEIYVVTRPTLPLVQANLVIKSGWSADPQNMPGLGSLTADMLDQGTKSRTALQISDAMKRLGADFGTTSNFDASYITLNVLKRNFDQAFAIMADVALNPVFPLAEMDRQRTLYLGRIQQEAQQPLQVAFKAFYKLLYGERHPYGEPYTGTGTEASLKAMTRDDLVKFYQTNFMPNNAALIFVGNITMGEAKAVASQYFGIWKQGTVPKLDIPQPAPLDKTKIYIVDKPGAVQSVVVAGQAGLPRTSPDFTAAQVVNNAFGGQFSSRINMNLREDKGFTYGAFAVFNSRRGPGAFFTYAPVQAQSTKETVSEMVREIRELVSTRPLSDEELVKSKDNLIKSLPQDFQSDAGIANLVGLTVQTGLPADYWSTYASQVTSIDAATAAAKAKQIIHPDNLLIVVVGDRAKIEDGIRQLGIGEVVSIPTAQL